MDEKTSIQAVVVGYMRSPITGREQAPRQGRDTGQEAVISILPEYADALELIESRERLLVTCWLHLAPRDILKVHRRGDVSQPLTGVFGTRSPARPNPISIYTVDLLHRDGLELKVRGMDTVDGTPVLDIKPFIRRLDG